MSPDLLALADEVFAAAHSGDEERLRAHWSPTFDVVVLEGGAPPRTVAHADLLTPEARRAAGRTVPGSVDDVEVLHTAVDDHRGVLVLRWDGHRPGRVTTLVWDLAHVPPLLLRGVVADPPT